MNSRLTVILLFAVASVAWGVPYLFVKLALVSFDPLFMVFARAAVAAAVLMPFAARRGLLTPLGGRMRALAWLAVLDLTAPTLLVTVGLTSIDSGLAGTLVASVPVMVALLALRFDATERAAGLRLVGLAFGMAGVGALLGLQLDGGLRALAGAWLVVGAAASYAGGALYYKRFFADLPAFGVVCGSLTACALLTAVPTLVFAWPQQPPTAQALIAVAVLALGTTAGGYVALYALITRVGAGRALVITYIAPVISVGCGVAFLHEKLGASAVAGMFLILAGSWLSTGGRPPRWSRRRRSTPADGSYGVIRAQDARRSGSTALRADHVADLVGVLPHGPHGGSPVLVDLVALVTLQPERTRREDRHHSNYYGLRDNLAAPASAVWRLARKARASWSESTLRLWGDSSVRSRQFGVTGMDPRDTPRRRVRGGHTESASANGGSDARHDRAAHLPSVDAQAGGYWAGAPVRAPRDAPHRAGRPRSRGTSSRWAR